MRRLLELAGRIRVVCGRGRRGLPAHAEHPAGHDDDRAALRRCTRRCLAVPEGLFGGDIPPHRVTRLRRQGERYFADGLRELPDSRRLAILVVCAAEWETFVADAVVETHDRIVGRTYRKAARTSEAQLGDETAAVLEALDAVIADRPG